MELIAIQTFQETAVLQRTSQRNGAFVLVGLAALGWIIIFWSAANMSSPLMAMTMPMDATWSPSEVFAVWLMWAVMMGAMMLPSAIPMLMVHRRVAAKRDPASTHSQSWFLIGYLAGWAVFSTGAAVLQWGFQSADVLSHMLRLQNPVIAGFILVIAGIFQFTSIKNICLKKCRTPIGFLLTDWRPGHAGAFQMGLSHGKYCVGCCWALMLVLFVGGVMNLTTIAVLSCIVLFEKLMPHGAIFAKLGGVVLIVWGLILVV